MHRQWFVCTISGVISLCFVITISEPDSKYVIKPLGPKMCDCLCRLRIGCSGYLYRPTQLLCQPIVGQTNGSHLALRGMHYFKVSKNLQVNPRLLAKRNLMCIRNSKIFHTKGKMLKCEYKQYGIGSECSGDNECGVSNSVCFNGTCLCTPGYSYIKNEDKCNRTCRNYGQSMTPYPELGIKKYNEKLTVGISAEDCVSSCVNETSFVCLSAEVNSVYNSCHLQAVGYLDVIIWFRETRQTGCVLHVRNCAP